MSNHQEIWKYELRPVDRGPQKVLLPAGATLLSAGEQDGKLVIWALVDPNTETHVTWIFRVT